MSDQPKEIALEAIDVLETQGILRPAEATTYREQIRATDSAAEIEEIVLRMYKGSGVDEQRSREESLTPIGNPKRN